MTTPKKSGYNSEWFASEVESLNKLSKTHTAYQVAKILGRTVGAVQSKAKRLKVSFAKDETNTLFGQNAENYVERILPGAKRITRDNYHAPYDIDWNGKRINVKAATIRFLNSAKGWYWAFTVRQEPTSCDFYLFLGYEKEAEKPIRAWLVPSNFPKKGVVLIGRSKDKNMYKQFDFTEVLT